MISKTYLSLFPSDLATYGRDAKALLKELQSQNERMFLVTFLVLNTGRTEQELENNVFQASSIAQKHNCNLCRLDFQQEQGLMSSLPLADCQIEIQRGLTTSSTAIFIPFTTQELYQSGKESLYYGLNALSNNLIMVDRKKLKNPNGLILGTPGSGKSFSAKREIANAFLVTDDDIIINDPEGEYSPLVNRLKGQVIKISPNSTQFVNPMDINANYSEEDNPLSLKADFILSLCELVVGGKDGLMPVEKTVIDRCVHLIYRKYFADPCPENMPILEDLYNALLQQDEKEAHHVATALEIYVKGSLNLFNHRTNVNVNNRIVCYDIKELGKQMKKLNKLEKSTKRRAKNCPLLLFCRRLKSKTNCVSTAPGLRVASSVLWHCTRPSPTAISVSRHWQRNTASVGTPTIIWMAAEGLSTTTGEEWNLTITPNTRNSR